MSYCGYCNVSELGNFGNYLVADTTMTVVDLMVEQNCTLNFNSRNFYISFEGKKQQQKTQPCLFVLKLEYCLDSILYHISPILIVGMGSCL